MSLVSDVLMLVVEVIVVWVLDEVVEELDDVVVVDEVDDAVVVEELDDVVVVVSVDDVTDVVDVVVEVPESPRMKFPLYPEAVQTASLN